ncbi:pyridoxal 5'-phosphate synthase [Rhodococcus sp. ARC_M6]|uniref:pyridoxine/pyridoxamine 5'-phosphate oxidase n=1 Tax=Rhodococcus sp. ARC_M6 TaxID=2928852 RepID=UPI001FB437BF|nr:pyridoxal 5'-phosphate synthase [Rhodococcus sp. ARC_M6]MCJ0904054.1 pyridoxal 5'-phosphate synthase [Rhodococcus sp. ARC_M6]
MAEDVSPELDTRAWMRGIPALTGVAPDAPTEFPSTPSALFLTWLREAVDGGAAEPHVCALSTVDDEGMPDSRFLILKDVGDRGFWFSGSARSPKGVELTAHPRASLAFYWRESGQQIRVRGVVREGDEPVRARDFVERSVTARAVATASRQSQELADSRDYERAVASAVDIIEADPAFVSDDWRAWCLEPESVEFWQADPGRRHLRWLYRRTSDGRWTVTNLWP